MIERWEGDGPNVRCRRELIRFEGLICLKIPLALIGKNYLTFKVIYNFVCSKAWILWASFKYNFKF